MQNGARARPTPLSPREAEVASVALAATPAAPFQRRGVEMNSIDTLTLNSTLSNNKPKPPAVYFGAGASSKSQPGVVTISEYPNSDRRAAPSRLDFLASNPAPGNETIDSQGALASELHNTLSRSNLRQLSEPVPAPPPPPEIPSPPLSPSPLVNGSHTTQDEQQHTNPILEMRRVKTKVAAINAFRRPQSQSPPPVIALKPLAVPYTELVTKKNQHQVFNEIENGHVEPQIQYNNTNINNNEIKKQNQHDDNKNITKSQQQSSTPIQNTKNNKSTEYSNNSSLIMDTLSNKVTIKFPNGQSASAGTKNLNALLATAPTVTQNQSSSSSSSSSSGILKQHGKPKHRTVIHQKSITFGEM